MKFIQLICFLIFLSLFSSCFEDSNSKFDNKKWLIHNGFTYPHRESMVKDLIETYLYSGAKYDNMPLNLGTTVRIQVEPQNLLVKYYEVSQEYGFDIDPYSLAYLKIILNSEREVIKSSIIEFE